MRLISLIAGCSLLTACMLAPPAENPMPVEYGQAEKSADTLVVFLPGRFPREDDFRNNGFFDKAREAGIDMVAADGHFGYYRAETLTDRLEEDVIQPAIEAGYKHIWLAGISLGGFGSILYADDYPDAVDGVILFAPYTGHRRLVREISEQGAFADWNREASQGEDYERRAWRRLHTLVTQEGRPPLLLAYGIDDRFERSNQLLADALPDDQVFTVEGGHNWDAWRPLWSNLLEAGFPQALNRENAAP
jgi:pimeloyl-ACP methyl ester carboxylesterase